MEDYHSKIVKAGFVPMVLNSQQSIKYIAEQTEIFKKLLAEHNLSSAKVVQLLGAMSPMMGIRSAARKLHADG